MNPLIEAAEQYLGLGLQVIALTGKTPNVAIHRHGLKDAWPNDYTVSVAKAMEHPATTGVGILTSYPLVVVDIDGEEGAQAWHELVGGDWLPQTWIAATGRGLHLYLGAPWLQAGSMKVAEKLDLKGEGGYVAAPPSLHPEGRTYEWLSSPSDTMLATIPDALDAKIRLHLFEAERRIVKSKQHRLIRHAPLEDGKLWAEEGFEGLLKGMDDAASGNRNNYLHWAAATMAEQGASEEDFADLRERALSNGLTGLEVKRTIRSARRLHADAE